jgi:hypothetical protein
MGAEAIEHGGHTPSIRYLISICARLSSGLGMVRWLHAVCGRAWWVWGLATTARTTPTVAAPASQVQALWGLLETSIRPGDHVNIQTALGI